MAIIEVNNLTKEYRLGHMASAKQSVINTIARLRGQPIKERERFLALDDVNFSVEEGEVVGIIGHNGAGKSTLLKHLASITNPTRGSVKVKGSVAPLIEVGAGVNPELTGRENIFLNGAILGIPKQMIRTKLDEIIAFSELEQFIDTPVKRYSSGMTVKLGFSIATSLDADILIIDEVLAVGDLAFQRKCFDRMEDLIRKQGKTVLLVSHNIRQVTRMCSRVILLDHGRVSEDGPSDFVCNKFYEENNLRILSSSSKNLKTKDDGQIVVLGDVTVTSEKCAEIKTGDPLVVDISVKILKTIVEAEIVVGTHTTDFIYLTASSSDQGEPLNYLLPGLYKISYVHKSFPLKAGVYALRISIFDGNRCERFSEENIGMFTVLPNGDESRKPPLRLLDIPGSLTLEKNNEEVWT